MLGRITVAAAFVLASGAALADGHSVGMRAGGLGLGIDYAYTFKNHIALRVGANGSSYGFDEEASDVHYDFDLDWDSVSVAVDFFPGDRALHFTVGALDNSNGLDAVGAPTAPVEIGDTTYPPALVGTLTGAVEYDGTSPFVALGWDWSRGKRLGFALDLGLLDQGTPDVALNATGLAASTPGFQQDLDAEEAQIQDDFKDLELLPYLSLGFVVRF
jgi:hypothetical protein